MIEKNISFKNFLICNLLSLVVCSNIFKVLNPVCFTDSNDIEYARLHVQNIGALIFIEECTFTHPFTLLQLVTIFS